MYQKGKGYYLKLTILSLCTALALSMNFAPAMEEGVNGLSAVYPDMKNGFGNTSFVATLLFGILFFSNYRLDLLKKEKIPGRFICFLLACVWVMGESFHLDNTLSALSCSYVQILKTLIYVLGVTYLLNQLLYLLKWWLDSTALDGKDLPQRENRLLLANRKHPFLCPFLILLVGLLPQLIFSYPVGMSWDARYQLSQFFGLDSFTSHHPPASTWLMGKVVSFGLLFGNGNTAVFLYAVLQYFLFAAITAYMIYTIRVYFHAPRWLQLTSIIVALVSPYHAAYIGVMLKDVIYAYMILLMAIEIMYMLNPDDCFWRSGKHMVLFWISASLTILLRNNGRYVVYPTILALIIYFCYKGMKKANRVKMLVLVMAVFLSEVTVLGFLNKNYVEQAGSVREALSLPFQQTARYLKEYGADVTEEEKEVISRVLDYESLPELYDPEISDPVKGTYHPEASQQDLKAYFQVWIKQFFKHPMVYIEATMNQNYFLLWPKAELYNYFTDVVYEDYEPSLRLAQYLSLHEVDATVFRGISTLQTLYVATSLMLPILGMTSNIAFYNILLIFLMIFALKHKIGKVILLMIPLLMGDLIIVAAPYVSPRYMLPIMYSMPLVLALYIYERKQKVILLLEKHADKV